MLLYLYEEGGTERWSRRRTRSTTGIIAKPRKIKPNMYPEIRSAPTLRNRTRANVSPT